MKTKVLVTILLVVSVCIASWVSYKQGYGLGYSDGEKNQISTSNATYETVLASLGYKQEQIAEGMTKIALLWSFSTLEIYEHEGKEKRAEELKSWISNLHVRFNLFEISDYEFTPLSAEEIAELGPLESDLYFAAQALYDFKEDSKVYELTQVEPNEAPVAEAAP